MTLNLDKLVSVIEDVRKRRELSDDYLKSIGLSTRDEEKDDKDYNGGYGTLIGEHGYGWVMVEVNEILPFLKELQKLKGNGFEVEQEVKEIW